MILFTFWLEGRGGDGQGQFEKEKYILKNGRLPLIYKLDELSTQILQVRSWSD